MISADPASMKKNAEAKRKPNENKRIRSPAGPLMVIEFGYAQRGTDGGSSFRSLALSISQTEPQRSCRPHAVAVQVNSLGGSERLRQRHIHHVCAAQRHHPPVLFLEGQ